MFTFASTFHKAFMKDTSCGSSSVGRALASQAKGRGFEPRLPLHLQSTDFQLYLKISAFIICL